MWPVVCEGQAPSDVWSSGATQEPRQRGFRGRPFALRQLFAAFVNGQRRRSIDVGLHNPLHY